MNKLKQIIFDLETSKIFSINYNYDAFNQIDGKSQLFIINDLNKNGSSSYLNDIQSLLSFFESEENSIQNLTNQQEKIAFIRLINNNKVNEKSNLENLRTNSKQKIIITYEILKVLNSNQILDSINNSNSNDNLTVRKNEFINHIQMFDDISIEIKYPNNEFEDIYRKILTIKNGIKYKAHKELKISVYININTTNCHFKNDHHISSVIFGPNVETIHGGFGVGSFEDCSSLKEIKISRNIKAIGGGAFNLCVRLRNFEIPRSVTFIDNISFCSCCKLIYNSINS